METVPLQTHSCGHCQKVVFDLRHSFEKLEKVVLDSLDLSNQLENGTFGANPESETKQKDETNMAERGALFDVTFGELCTGAGAGCRLFNWIMDDEWISRERIQILARKEVILIDDTNSEIRLAFRNSSLWFRAWLREPCLENTLHRIRSSLGASWNRCRLWASTYGDNRNSLDVELNQFFCLWDPDYHNCKTMPGVMPTRLIEIAGIPEAIRMRLRQTEETGRLSFAALSYCWGGEQPMKCLGFNIVSYGTTISSEKQPSTIKDATKDDPTDKSGEIAKMPSIYGSAKVTIVAARSVSVMEGFWGKDFLALEKAPFFSYRCMDGEIGSISLVKLDNVVEPGFEPIEPIDERGWTLQERLLSSRIIEFGSRQTRWIWFRSSDFPLEDFTDGWRRDVNFSDKRRTEALDPENFQSAWSRFDFYGRLRDSHCQEYLNTVEHWEQICKTFTERALILSSDRALAISGIAQVFAGISGDQYFAGLWKSCFHSGLLWTIHHVYRSTKIISQPATYQGPSWSWPSVNGPVNFAQVCRPSECVAEILSCEPEPAHKRAPYGLVREGFGRLVLSTPTAPAMITKVPKRSPGEDELLIMGISESVVCFAFAKINCDVERAEIHEEGDAGCLLAEISRRNERDQLHCQGLVLRWSSPEKKHIPASDNFPTTVTVKDAITPKIRNIHNLQRWTLTGLRMNRRI